MKVAIIRERQEHEKRVAATPETVKKYISMGLSVAVETGAGDAASFSDTSYTDAGAVIAKSAADALKDADIVLKIQIPTSDEIALIKTGAAIASLASPHKNKSLIEEMAAKNISLFGMELIPRITRAQSMDVLSSQSNLAGYKAVLDAAEVYGRAFPLMMTAAGTVTPAKVFVMGAGVAGLQAVATAKRLGAVVSATDVRMASKEQVESLGASFVMVIDDEVKQAETAGGYAKEMSDEYKKKQAALIAETIVKQDIVITTALIPGRPAPVLVTEEHVKSMKPGSVIIDMAVEQGGNCPLSEPGKVVKKHGVTLVGHLNVPSRLPEVSSALFAKNFLNFMGLIVKDGKMNIDRNDEIIKGCGLCAEGKLIHPAVGGTPLPVKETKKESDTPETKDEKADTKKPAAKNTKKGK